MPLARLSIKSALSLAQSAVTIWPSPSGPWWVVRVNHGASKAVFTGEWTKAEAKVARRKQRIMLALLSLEFDEALASRLAAAAVAGHDTRDWRKVVAAHVERRELTGIGWRSDAA